MLNSNMASAKMYHICFLRTSISVYRAPRMWLVHIFVTLKIELFHGSGMKWSDHKVIEDAEFKYGIRKDISDLFSFANQYISVSRSQDVTRTFFVTSKT